MLVHVSIFIIKVLPQTMHCVFDVADGKEKADGQSSCPVFAPQDSDGDKSEDNLVVDVSNEVS